MSDAVVARPRNWSLAQSRDEHEQPVTCVAGPDLRIEQLAERSKAGCRESFELLVEHFERRLFHFLYQMTRNRHDAEDLTQVTFLKA